MTEVEFHVNLPDRLQYACRLLRKAYRKGVRVAVTASPSVLTEMDRQLWACEPEGFLPHVYLADKPVAASALPLASAAASRLQIRGGVEHVGVGLIERIVSWGIFFWCNGLLEPGESLVCRAPRVNSRVAPVKLWMRLLCWDGGGYYVGG